MKLKTHKGLKKRTKITGSKRVLRKRARISHFNAREETTKTNQKKTEVEVHKSHQKQIKKMLINQKI